MNNLHIIIIWVLAPLIWLAPSPLPWILVFIQLGVLIDQVTSNREATDSYLYKGLKYLGIIK